MKNILKSVLPIFLLINIFSCGYQKSTFIDKRDGHLYKTIKIGKKVWFSENLAFTTDTGCWAYNDNLENVLTYGYLYDYASARKACPVGWHLPSDEEWKQLEQKLGMPQNEVDTINIRGVENKIGGMLKSKSSLWEAPNKLAKKISGFDILPSGYRYFDGSKYKELGETGVFWTQCTDDDQLNPQIRSFTNKSTGSDRHKSYHTYGFSVRCVKD